MAISLNEWALAEGASLLFLTNIVSITLAAWATLVWLGMRPGKGDDPKARRRVSTLLAIILVAILVALNLRSLDTVASGRIETVLRDSFQQAELINYEVRQSDPLEVVAAVRQPAGKLNDRTEIIAARDALEELIDAPVKLSVVIEPFVDADVAAASIEMETNVDRILREEIQTGELIESLVIPGNPTIVFALISTDVDPDSEPFASEIRRAEVALTEIGRVPVELQVLTTQAGIGEAMEMSNEAFTELISQSLNESIENGDLVSFTFQVGNPFVVKATISTEMDLSSEEPVFDAQAAEDALADALGLPVMLEVTIQSPGES